MPLDFTVFLWWGNKLCLALPELYFQRYIVIIATWHYKILNVDIREFFKRYDGHPELVSEYLLLPNGNSCEK